MGNQLDRLFLELLELVTSDSESLVVNRFSTTLGFGGDKLVASKAFSIKDSVKEEVQAC
jgi:hypothetical protein